MGHATWATGTSLTALGSATLNGSFSQLTTAGFQAGNLWSTAPFPVTVPFSTFFTFSITGCVSGSTCADGFSFLVRSPPEIFPLLLTHCCSSLSPLVFR